LNASKRLKSDLFVKDILQASSSLSKEHYWIKELMSSSSSVTLRIGFLEGEGYLSTKGLWIWTGGCKVTTSNITFLGGVHGTRGDFLSGMKLIAILYKF
jgi:hypothetical protein